MPTAVLKQARRRGAAGWIKGGWCLLLVLAAAGCYEAVPLTHVPPPAGTRVVARLTTDGSAELAPWIGAGARAVEGVVVSNDPGRMELSLLRVEQVTGGEVLWNREVVAIPSGAVGEIRERRLHKQRSLLTAGILTVGAVVLGRVFLSSVFDGSDEGGGPPPPPQ